MTCERVVRLLLLGIFVMLIVFGSAFIAFSMYTPQTHLELNIIRKHSDGTVENITYTPKIPPLQVITVEGRTMDWNDTLYLYIKWVIEPRDWKPLAKISTDAYLKLEKEGAVIIDKKKLYETHTVNKVVEDGARDMIYKPITITKKTLLNTFGYKDISQDYGNYILTILYTTRYSAKDPYGAIHINDLNLKYTLRFAIMNISQIFNVTGTIEFGGASLSNNKPVTFAFRQSRTIIFEYGVGMILVGAIGLIFTYIYPLYRVLCRVRE